MSGNVRGIDTEANPASSARSSVPVPRITVVSGAGVGRAFAMTGVSATIGRHPTNDLVIPDPRVSGVHVELQRSVSGVYVRDAGSTNGTWLGAHRVTEIELAVGGEIRVGDATLRLDRDAEAAPAKVSARTSFGELVGASVVMRELFATLERIAPKELSVLVQGETGTGKEEVARALHAASPRAANPFVVIDATSLPEALAESLLFGHERGAFTGATERRIGYFEAADTGTVFLDEVGELPAALQGKFLRVLERREVTRVGGSAPIKIDVRLLTATHRDLRNEIDAGRFREDLYYRLAQVRVHVPPLRDRTDDLPLLAQKLLSEVSTSIMIDADAAAHLAAQPWPGNVRELRNVLFRAGALSRDGIIRRSDVAGEGGGFRGTPEERSVLDVSGTFPAAKDSAIERFESAYLAALMRRCAGNLSRASREAHLTRHHLRSLLKKRGLYAAPLDEDD